MKKGEICLEINYFTVINFLILFALIVGAYIVIRAVKNFINKNKEMDKKIDDILDKLEDKDNSK
ncbi:hypothetical protein Clopa_1109 [Clostridium pasteurianum BC1]|uniref:DUF4083 domain-containing protein n=1 Tax=Clostridium pasteurianum BC1 TaxID=86416 RepID=R4K0M1_CLOPA|nr:hypothetical protein Clopa_1109 [Clostridium pasteurianum BC1]